jgi:hypothetical protein
VAGLLRRVWAGLPPLALAAVLPLAAGGCSASRSVVAVDLPAHALVPPERGDRLTSPDEAVRAISAVMTRELGLPVPDRVTVYLYSGREVFEQGLIRDANIAPVRAAELSDFAVGVGKRRQLLLHDEPGMDRGPEWLRLIAHEMTHVAQIELARGEGRAEQWLAEGMAEWVAFTVLERLQLDAVSRRHDVAVSGVRAQAALQAGRLDLQTLGTPRGFTMRHLREGSLPTYQLSFLMAEYLIHREGLPRVIEYFEAAAQSRDRQATFQRVFGQSLDQFEREVLQYLQLLVLAAEAAEARSRGEDARP